MLLADVLPHTIAAAGMGSAGCLMSHTGRDSENQILWSFLLLPLMHQVGHSHNNVKRTLPPSQHGQSDYLVCSVQQGMGGHSKIIRAFIM